MTAAARNLGLVMRKLVGAAKPRALQDAIAGLITLLISALGTLFRGLRGASSTGG